MAPSNPRVRLWSSLLLGLLACLLVPVAQAEMKYGINAKWGGGGYDELVARFALARSLGVKQVRIDWEWRLVEGQKGVYDWTPMDNLVKAAAEQDIELLPIVHYAPNWALPMLAFKSSGTFELRHSMATCWIGLLAIAGKISSYCRHSAPSVSFQSVLALMP